MRSWSVSILAAAALCTLQTAAFGSEPWQVTSSSARLYGVVRAYVGSAPIRYARVRAVWQDGFSETRTDALGNYSLRLPNSVRFTVEVTRSLHADSRSGEEFPAGPGARELNFSLKAFDRGWVVTSSQLGGQLDLRVQPGNEVTGWALTSTTANETGPAWSPDGTQIAFASDEAGPEGQIFVIERGGGGLRAVAGARGYAPSWSPDGTEIAYSTEEGLRVTRTDGSGTRALTGPYVDLDPAWSPDGSRIAFVRPFAMPFGGTDLRLYSVNVEGGDLRRIAAEHGTDQDPAWSPDGSRIAFTSTRDGEPVIYEADADGGNAVSRIYGASDPVWGPNESDFYYRKSRRILLDNGKVVHLQFYYRNFGSSSERAEGGLDWTPIVPLPDSDGDGAVDEDDACPLVSDANQSDADFDGRGDACDVCVERWNPEQGDANGDGYGDLCDGDIDGNGIVNFGDLALLRARFLTADPAADLNGDGVVNFVDLARLKERFLKPRGPAAARP